MPDPNQTDPNSPQPVVPTTDPVVPAPDSTFQIPDSSDVAPMPDFMNQSQSNDVASPAVVLAGTEEGSAAPVEFPSMVSAPKKKFGGGKLITTILGILVLVGGVGTGVYLTQQQQILAPKAVENGACVCKKANGTDCVPFAGSCTTNGGCDCAPNCSVKNNKCPGAPAPTAPGGVVDCVFDHYSVKQACVQVNGVWKRCDTTPVGEMGIQVICDTNGGDSFCIANYSDKPNCGTGGFCLAIAPPYCIPAGMAAVDAATCTSGASCGGTTSTPTPIPTAPPTPTVPPIITAQCQNIKAYTSAWVLLTTTQLSVLTAGNTVNFCVTGSASSGLFDKAKLTINGIAQAETTTVRPGGTDFCQNYTIPAATTTFNVTAQIHHVTLGWK